MNMPIMYGQITNNVELRSFAIQMAANISCDNVDTLIERAKVIESYVRGSAELLESPQNQNTMLENLCKLMAPSSQKKEEERTNNESAE